MDKTKIYLYILYLIVAMGIVALVSCASDDLVADGGKSGNRMSLGINVLQVQDASNTRAVPAPPIKNYQMKTDGKPVYVQMSSEAYIDRNATSFRSGSEEKESRGTSITADTFYDRFGLFYYQYPKSNTWAGIVSTGTESPTVSNYAVEKSAGWLTDKYWPGADHKLTFLAYAPYDEDYKNASGTKYIQFASSIKGYPSLTYTVPDKVEDQRDLLVSAEPGTQDMEGDYNKVIGMKFYHALSAINFKIGSTMAPGRIAKIEIKGIYNKGDYDFGTRGWTNQSGSADYSITPNYIVDKQRGVVFTGVEDSKNDLFLVMPQTVPSGAKIVVTIEDGANYSSSHEMELPIDEHEWLAGYTITYSLSTSQENSDYIFSVSKINDVTTEQASTVNYKVSSYVQSYYGSQTPVGWTAKYAVDEAIDYEEYTNTLGDVVNSGFVFSMPTPTSTTTSLTAKVSALLPPVSNPANNVHTQTLRSRAALGTEENPYDLSTLGGTRAQCTANCYVVGAPGWYKFPVVYGNCIKDGANNTAVYQGSSTLMNSFVNHRDARITAPYLVDNNLVVPREAIMIWQDAYNMVEPSSVKLSDDYKYITFKVNEDYICQGNALLSVRDESKKILWSWNIWVTDENLDNHVPVTNLSNSVYNLMTVPLGFCSEDKRIYTPRKIEFLFEQENSGLQADVNFVQSTQSYLEYGKNAPFYEYGRFAPESISNGILSGNVNKGNKPLYYASDYVVGYKTGTVSMGTSIQTPYIHYGDGDSFAWCKTNPNNVWDVSNTSTNTYDKSSHLSVKSVYDPCPVGYKVPEPLAFSAFTLANSTGVYDKGRYFYTKPSKGGELLFVPLLGTNSSQVAFAQGGYFMSGGNGTNRCWLFYYTTSSVSPYFGAKRCIGRTIWPVVDE